MVIDKDVIQKILPHRPPFLFLHEVRITELGRRGSADISCAARAAAAQGLLADFHEIYHELILESAAQTLGVVLASDPTLTSGNNLAERHLLLYFEQVEFYPDCAFEADFRVEVTLLESFANTHKAMFNAIQHGQRICQGQFAVMKG